MKRQSRLSSEKVIQHREKIKREVYLFDKQFEAFNFSTQFGAVIAGVQSGKTFLGSYWARNKMERFKGLNGLICAPTYKVLQQSTLEKFFQIWPDLRKHYKEQKGLIELPSGGKVFMRSADQPLGIEGMTVHWAWLDEAGMMPRLIWAVVRSRVSLTKGQVLITTTPYNMGWLYQDFYLPWKERKDPDLSVFTWRSIDSPFFPKEFAQKEKQRLRPEEFARRYEGEFRRMEGLVYELPPEQIVKPVKGIIEKAEFVGAGIDWGFRNPTAILVGALYDNVWYVIDDWKEAEKTTTEIIQVLKDKISEFRIQRVYPDPAEPDRIQELKNAGVSVANTNKDILGGISFIQQLIKEKRFFVFNTCQNFLDEINSYHYPEGQEGKPFKDEPEKINDHLMDAMRYLVYSYRSQKSFIVPEVFGGTNWDRYGNL